MNMPRHNGRHTDSRTARPITEMPRDAESLRLAQDGQRQGNWKRWGPYLSERQWGTVREDYSADGDCWNYFSHDQARSRAYRWGEDGLLGFTDRQCRLCFALALWNGRDPILKERLFGLTNPEGNHGEDVKEQYFYLDSTPTHSYMKALYKYPQAEFPYARLVEENRRRAKHDREFELTDTGVFDGNRYFDVFAEYAKASAEDVLIKITIANRGPEPATIHVLPTLWFRNTWSWGRSGEGHVSPAQKPRLTRLDKSTLVAEHLTLGQYRFAVDAGPDGEQPQFIFTENETNTQRLFDSATASSFVKDAFHEFVIHGNVEAVNPQQFGTKAAAHYRLHLQPGEEISLRLRLMRKNRDGSQFSGAGFDGVFASRIREADEFYTSRIPQNLSDQEQLVARQAYAGLLWTKQFYHYVVDEWKRGDPAQPAPPHDRSQTAARNADWGHLFNRDIISVCDKWEYPWFAAWDLAFHMIPFAKVDPQFAKDQLLLFLREWYMHPNGQIPAYEFAFSDVNPPVHAWACWRVYKMTGKKGQRDRLFLARAFQKLMLNFTWWVNRKDPEGKNIFAGGFLGMDNIGVFDRSQALPTGGHLEQADGTAWMAFYCATMLAMALELASEDPAYEDVASKFFEHFVAIADAMNTLGGNGLWDEYDGFYYDQLHVDHQLIPLRVRSMVGLMPLIAVEILEEDVIQKLPGFRKRMQWFLDNRKDLAKNISYMETLESDRACAHHLLAIPTRQRLQRVLQYLFDENEFLSPFGLRSVSRIHADKPYVFQADGQEFRVDYVPGESTTGLFGGNSNWRGPIWFPVNYLLIEALERYHHFYGDSFVMECPTGSGQFMTLEQAAHELRRRLASIFLPSPGASEASGEPALDTRRRPCHGEDNRFATDPHWRDLLLFHEYFHAETGRGLGASHQTGWTALVASCLDTLGRTTTAKEHKTQRQRAKTAAIARKRQHPNFGTMDV
jgi:hypothetical protein